MKRDKRIDDFLLSINSIPSEFRKAEQVTEKMTGKKLSNQKKVSVKLKAAMKNYKKAVKRFHLANTLLDKNFKTFSKLVNKYLRK